jgi:hypothetical protein
VKLGQLIDQQGQLKEDGDDDFENVEAGFGVVDERPDACCNSVDQADGQDNGIRSAHVLAQPSVDPVGEAQYLVDHGGF